MTTALVEPLFVQLGQRRYQVESFEQASAMWCKARNASGADVHQAPGCQIVTAEGRTVAHISYNGRVWPGEEWKPGMTPLCEAAA